ncbi:MAG TPA: glycosyltransferase [Candidatus Thermoplasmatota archaeon]|nr:glycosyltransferase [Candidatus Thermoplasmatota archaeon]
MSENKITLARLTRALAAAGAGGALGAAAGLGAYAGLVLLMTSEGVSLDLFNPFTSFTRLGFMLLGAAAGAAVAGEVTGAIRARRVIEFALGTIAGGLSGLLLYCIGYVTGNYGVLPTSWEYLLYLAEGAYSFTHIEAFCVTMGLFVGFLTVTYRWRFYGTLTYVSLVAVVSGYLVYTFTITLPTVPRAHLPLSLVLVVAETASLLMVTLYAFYALDVFVRKGWSRALDKVPFSRYYLPKVAFHVTCFNEPPELVIESLQALERLDYPKDRYVVMVLDDSTDPASSGPIEAYVRSKGWTYLHRKDRRGYKAGALNNALKYTPQDVELVSVLDADFRVEPEYLKETVGYFINPNLGFIQTPQDYRNKHQSFLTEQYYYADAYFYRAMLVSRNEENAIIFCGTMGLIRKRVLEGVGGWGEEFITEDAELSIRVLAEGYDSLYVNKTYGRGLIPSTFEAYKKQHYRWAFGGVMILKRHFTKLLFSRLTFRQKLDFLVSGVHWFDGIYVISIAAVLCTIVIGEALGVPLATYHSREIWLMGLVPFFLMLDGVTRLHMALKRSMNLRLSGTVKVMGMWFAIKFNHMSAALKCMSGVKIPFVRTPKAPDARLNRRQALLRAIRLTRLETGLLTMILATAGVSVWMLWERYDLTGKIYLTHLLLLFWLAYYALLFSAAPLYAYKAYTTFVPDEELEPKFKRHALDAAPAVAPMPPMK